MFSAVPCSSCGFTLWHPLLTADLLQVGLYDDRRYPGHLLAMPTEHYVHLEEVPAAEAARMLWSLQDLMGRLRAGLGAERVVFSAPEDEVPHLHFHLVPLPSVEEAPGELPPWALAGSPEELWPEQLEATLQKLRLTFNC